MPTPTPPKLRLKLTNLLTQSSWFLALTLTGCKPLVIAMYGDSTIYQSGEEIAADAQARGHAPISIATLSGHALGHDLNIFVQRAQQFSSVPTDVALVSLGSADVWDFADMLLGTWAFVDTVPELDAAIDTFLTALPNVPVVWVVPSAPGLNPTKQAHFRARLEAACARWPKLSLLYPDPTWYDGGDTIHFPPANQPAMAKALVDAAEAAWLGGPR